MPCLVLRFAAPMSQLELEVLSCWVVIVHGGQELVVGVWHPCRWHAEDAGTSWQASDEPGGGLGSCRPLLALPLLFGVKINQSAAQKVTRHRGHQCAAGSAGRAAAQSRQPACILCRPGDCPNSPTSPILGLRLSWDAEDWAELGGSWGAALPAVGARWAPGWHVFQGG